MNFFKAVCLIAGFLFIQILSLYAQVNEGELKGNYASPELNEISGIAASHKYANTFYVHNDSGDTSRFFSVNEKGQLKATYYFKGDELSFLGVADCEDITIGVGPDENKQYIYLADIGDNAAMRPDVHIYRFEEPVSDSGVVKNIDRAMLTLTYPDGAQDAETLMIDPLDQMLYIVSKQQRNVAVYTTPLMFSDHDIVRLQLVCKLNFTGKRHDKWIVSGSISTDGKQVMFKSTKKVYYWQRNASEPLYKAMQRKPLELPYTQKGQEEGICFSYDGGSYYITGEGKNAGIYKYEIPSQVLAALKK